MNKGGTSHYIYHLSKGLGKEGVENLTATGFVEASEIEDPRLTEIPYIRIQRLCRKINLFNDLRARANLKHVIRSFQPDIVYSHTFKAGLLVRSLKLKIPVVHAFHGHLLTEPVLSTFALKVYRLIERFLSKRTDFFVTVGQNVYTELLSAGIGKKVQHRSISPGVPDNFEQLSRSIPEKLGDFADKKVVISWLARLAPVKAPQRVFEIAKHFPDVIFLIVGGGELFNELSQSLPSNVKLLGWQNPSLIWSASDIVISTSFNEGIPIALIEAHLAEKPIVAMDVGAVSEIVVNGKTGFLHSKFDYDFLASVETLVRSRKLRRQFGQEGRKHALANFSVEQLVKKHIEIFENLI